jgi:ComF family protein
MTDCHEPSAVQTGWTTPLPPPPAPSREVPGWRQRLLGGARALLDVLYPAQCPICAVATAEPALCPACWRGTRLISRPYCERLGTPFPVDIGTTLLSPAALADPPVFDRARAVAVHDGPARVLVHRLKYGDRLDLAPWMCRLMAQAGSELLADAQVLVPVPLHWTRAFARRFNQAALLAGVIAHETGLPLAARALVRRRRTPTQVGLTRAERRANVDGAIIARPGAEAVLTGRRVLLIDDVLTSGATANACARHLLKAGATAVDVLTFSRVVDGL